MPVLNGKELRIVGFLCNWCSYGGADTAGTARAGQPTDLRIIRVPCSGRIDPLFIVKALLNGADGVLVSGCHPRDCHYAAGNFYARRRLEVLKQFQDKEFSFTHVKCEHCEREADSVCCPCGHHAWCSDCAKVEETKGGAFCPRCHCRCAKTTRIFDADLCSICLTNAADTILLPCGHKCACYTCAECAWEEKKTCPICNLPMWSFRHEFPV